MISFQSCSSTATDRNNSESACISAATHLFIEGEKTEERQSLFAVAGRKDGELKEESGLKEQRAQREGGE